MILTSGLLNDFFDDNTTRPGRTPEYVAKNILTAAKTIKQGSPETKIFTVELV